MRVRAVPRARPDGRRIEIAYDDLAVYRQE
jgi:hypothetical protein